MTRKLGNEMRIALGLLLAAATASISGALAARAQETAYVVTYVEAEVTSKNAAAAALAQLTALGRRAGGNVRFEVLQNIYRPQQFAILEAWKDQRARQTYAGRSQVKQARDKLAQLLISPLDERPHLALTVGPDLEAPAAAVFVVTPIDIIPPRERARPSATDRLADQNASAPVRSPPHATTTTLRAPRFLLV